MKKSELWKIYTTKNAHWLSENVTFTPDGLKKLFEQTFDHAHKQGYDNGLAAAKKLYEFKNRNNPNGKSNAFNDVFGDIFGGKK